jgi:hypothetical protein
MHVPTFNYDRVTVICVCECVVVCDSACVCVCVTVCLRVCVIGYRYDAVAAASTTPTHTHTHLPAAGSVLITTSGVGGTLFVSSTKPKSRARPPTTVMRLRFSVEVWALVGVCERGCVRARRL